MADQQDDFQRTEEPTQKRLADARRKGDAPRSQEVIAFASLSAAALSLWLAAGPSARGVAEIGAAFIDHPAGFEADGAAIAATARAAALKTGAAIAAFGALFMVAAIAGNVVQAMPVLNPGLLKPDPKRLSPAAGLKRIYGAAAFGNFAKGLAKLILVGAIMIAVVWPERRLLEGLPSADPAAALALSMRLTLRLLAFSLVAIAVIAALDYAWQRLAWRKRLRMTKEEVRREMRETEGDPQIKGRQRALREGRARRRMLAAVKDATVLVMNPTHFAVALKYEEAAGGAPLCVAKGLDDIALRLRAAANDAGVPVVENPPLARALYAAVEIDDEIPVEHYEAVAKLIGYVLGRSRAPAPAPRPRA